MHEFTPFYSPITSGFSSIFIPIVLLIALWTIVLKGFALWISARAEQKKWFIALLIINTFGILEIMYLIWFRPKETTATKTPVVSSSSPQA